MTLVVCISSNHSRGLGPAVCIRNYPNLKEINDRRQPYQCRYPQGDQAIEKACKGKAGTVRHRADAGRAKPDQTTEDFRRGR
jgi:hypothetical protein